MPDHQERGEVARLREYFKCALCGGTGRAKDGAGWGGGDCQRCHGAGTVFGPPDANPPVPAWPDPTDHQERGECPTCGSDNPDEDRVDDGIHAMTFPRWTQYHRTTRHPNELCPDPFHQQVGDAVGVGEPTRAEREKRLQPGGPAPFLKRTPQPDMIWRCPVCGYLTDEEGSSACPHCLGDIGDEWGDLWQPYVPASPDPMPSEQGSAFSAAFGGQVCTYCGLPFGRCLRESEPNHSPHVRAGWRNPDPVQVEGDERVLSPVRVADASQALRDAAGMAPDSWSDDEMGEYVEAVVCAYHAADPCPYCDGFGRASDLTRLREELDEAKFSPIGDNHHNAAACPYCNPEREAAEAKLRRYEEALREAAESFDEIADRPLAGFTAEVGMQAANQIATAAAFAARSALSPDEQSDV